MEGYDAALAPLIRPIAGRLNVSAADEWSITTLTKWSITASEKPRRWNQVVTAPPGFTMNQVVARGSSWNVAIEANNMSQFGALVRGVIKVLFWHLVQPLLYFWVFSQAFSGLEPVQKILGTAVAVWEGFYAISVLLCVLVNPAFLLVEVRASVRDNTGGLGYGSISFLVMYVIAPEKYVLDALFQNGGLRRITMLEFFRNGGGLLDVCGVGALGAGLGTSKLLPTLAIGYFATALSAMWAIGGFLVMSMQIGQERFRRKFGMQFILGCAGILAVFFVPFAAAKMQTR